MRPGKPPDIDGAEMREQAARAIIRWDDAEAFGAWVRSRCRPIFLTFAPGTEPLAKVNRVGLSVGCQAQSETYDPAAALAVE
jgi:antibiotic biosynthesis monooxygenase (ABM) superfamily enzyme